MTATTTQAAHRANVTTATVRAWCRMGAVGAVKTSGRWNIDEASLNRRINLGRRTAAKQLDAFRDTAAAAKKAEEIIETGSLIPMPNPYTYLAIASAGGSGYVVNTAEGSCTCKGHVYSGHCYHMLAAVVLETAPAAA